MSGLVDHVTLLPSASAAANAKTASVIVRTTIVGEYIVEVVSPRSLVRHSFYPRSRPFLILKSTSMPEGTVHAPLLLTKINLNAAETAGNNVSTAAAHENLARVETPGGRWGDHMGAASHFQETSTTSRIVGQAPLLLGLMLANNNNNNPNNTNPEASQPVGPVGTTIVHEHVAEVEIPSGKVQSNFIAFK